MPTPEPAVAAGTRLDEARGALAGLRCDPEAVTSAADDYGHLVHHVPFGVVRPADHHELAAAVRYGAARGLRVTPRGAGHSVFGQAQAEGGIVCDLTSLDRIHDIQPDRVTVEPGARWSSVLAAAAPHGLTPPVLTDYLELTVGGTLSAGGIGGASHHWGPQADNVLELHVMDAASGEVATCSPERNPERFFAALASHGSGGIITQVSIPLIPAGRRARVYRVPCPDHHALIASQMTAARDGRFDYLEGQIVASEASRWTYLIEAASFYSTSEPDDAALLNGLACDPVAAEIEDVDYASFCHRMVPGVQALATTGDWYRPHPWLSVFVPVGSADQYVPEALAGLLPEQVGPLPMLLYPLRRGRVPTPELRTPQTDGDRLFYTYAGPGTPPRAVLLPSGRPHQPGG